MKNYYEILEVDKNASQEVIEKAYKTLAKKYHPDLQTGSKQAEYAEKMKIINEAYEVLSNDYKRQQYNEKLQSEQKQEYSQNQGISQQEQDRIIRENYVLKQQLNMMGNRQQVDEGTIINMSRILNEQIKSARRQAHHDAYIQELKNRRYKVRYRHNLKYYSKVIIGIAVMILLCLSIYQIPPVKHFFQDMYNENIIFKAVVDIFKNTFSAGF